MDVTPQGAEAVVLAITEVKPRTIDRALALLESALKGRPAQSGCAGVWRTDAGALNQIISLWTASDQADAVRTSTEILSSLNDIRVDGRLLKLTAAPFSPPLLPRRSGRHLRISLLHLQAKIVCRDRGPMAWRNRPASRSLTAAGRVVRGRSLGRRTGSCMGIRGRQRVAERSSGSHGKGRLAAAGHSGIE